MMGSKRTQLTETVTSAVRSAGALTTTALILSGAALLIAAIALIVVARRPVVADLTRA